MKLAWLALGAACLTAAASSLFQDKEKLKAGLKDEVSGDWVYDDFPLGMAQARKAGKPMMIVFR